eukprot:TRINITY_DN13958_c0_g1_i4.p1 TRINITY_DN13958_c0_g1~~TRINITY_DN13958_c0_g1_i4.p1  ORF type:complete len:813 (+),score=149.93 TRINITY_DN13958_c0_g1_i4:108-2546(+)
MQVAVGGQRWVVVAPSAGVRVGRATDSSIASSPLPRGTVVTLELRDGRRALASRPVRGWLSVHTADGTPVLAPLPQGGTPPAAREGQPPGSHPAERTPSYYSPAPGGSQGSAGSEYRSAGLLVRSPLPPPPPQRPDDRALSPARPDAPAAGEQGGRASEAAGGAGPAAEQRRRAPSAGVDGVRSPPPTRSEPLPLPACRSPAPPLSALPRPPSPAAGGKRPRHARTLSPPLPGRRAQPRESPRRRHAEGDRAGSPGSSLASNSPARAALRGVPGSVRNAAAQLSGGLWGEWGWERRLAAAEWLLSVLPPDARTPEGVARRVDAAVGAAHPSPPRGRSPPILRRQAEDRVVALERRLAEAEARLWRLRGEAARRSVSPPPIAPPTPAPAPAPPPPAPSGDPPAPAADPAVAALQAALRSAGPVADTLHFIERWAAEQRRPATAAVSHLPPPPPRQPSGAALFAERSDGCCARPAAADPTALAAAPLAAAGSTARRGSAAGAAGAQLAVSASASAAPPPAAAAAPPQLAAARSGSAPPRSFLSPPVPKGDRDPALAPPAPLPQREPPDLAAGRSLRTRAAAEPLQLAGSASLLSVSTVHCGGTPVSPAPAVQAAQPAAQQRQARAQPQPQALLDGSEPPEAAGGDEPAGRALHARRAVTVRGEHRPEHRLTLPQAPEQTGRRRAHSAIPQGQRAEPPPLHPGPGPARPPLPRPSGGGEGGASPGDQARQSGRSAGSSRASTARSEGGTERSGQSEHRRLLERLRRRAEQRTRAATLIDFSGSTPPPPGTFSREVDNGGGTTKRSLSAEPAPGRV